MWSALESSSLSLGLVIVSGCTTIVLASALAYVLFESKLKKSGGVSLLSYISGSGSSSGGQDKNATAKAALSSSTAAAAGGSGVLSNFDPEKYPGGVITIYYGTQTGTAENFARTIEREGPEKGFYIHVVDFEDVTSPEDFIKSDVRDPATGMARMLVLTSTYGEGEPPDNATDFVEKLCEISDTTVLVKKTDPVGEAGDVEQIYKDAVEFGVFGLGNIQYEHYNPVGKFFDRVLEKLGGKRVVPLGLGDDDDDIESDFDTWRENVMWPALCKLYLPAGEAGRASGILKEAETEEMPECQYSVVYHRNGDASKAVKRRTRDLPLEEVHASSRHFFTSVDCPVKVVRELRKKSGGADGSTVHVEIDISKAKKEGKITYETADNLGVQPENEMGVVESVASSLGYDLDAVFEVQAASGHEWHGVPFPQPITVRECFQMYCDLTHCPRRSDLKLLARYATDSLDKKALIRMSSKEGRDEYKEKIVSQFVGIVDLLKLCPSISMPLEHFLSFVPLLQTRFYTISSSSSVNPNTVHLTVVTTEHTRPKDGTKFLGVCSGYLAQRLRPGVDSVRVFNRPSSFRLPGDVTKPVLMIGPGTGIAPMRALLHERRFQRQSRQPNVQKTMGKNILYFGCQKRKFDDLYDDELAQFQREGVLNELHVAYSREQSKKVYVQHLLEQNGTQTFDCVVNQGGYIYVCGAVKMGHDVHDALERVLLQNASSSPATSSIKTKEDAKEYLTGLTSAGRYVQELWA